MLKINFSIRCFYSETVKFYLELMFYKNSYKTLLPCGPFFFSLEYVCLSYHIGKVQSIAYKRHCFRVSQNLNYLVISLNFAFGLFNVLPELISKISMSSLLLLLVCLVFFVVVVCLFILKLLLETQTQPCS